jgi:hypothetical protein
MTASGWVLRAWWSAHLASGSEPRESDSVHSEEWSDWWWAHLPDWQAALDRLGETVTPAPRDWPDPVTAEPAVRADPVPPGWARQHWEQPEHPGTECQEPGQLAAAELRQPAVRVPAVERCSRPAVVAERRSRCSGRQP